MAARALLRVGLVGGGVLAGGTTVLVGPDNMYNTGIGSVRFGRAAVTVAKIVTDYQTTLYSGQVTAGSEDYAKAKSQVHKRSAEKLLELCCANGGAFVKVGQHLGSLEYLLPLEYVQTLKVLHSKAPESSLEEIKQVLQEELKCNPNELFIEFDEKPLGAASLAQVHRAKLADGREVAVKVQHPSVKHHSSIDMMGMEMLVSVVSFLFPDFRFEWLVEEMKKNLPRELDFVYEGKNAERMASQYTHYKWLKIPGIEWQLSSERVLVMEFCQGGQVDDRQYMIDHGIDMQEVSQKIGMLYSDMIFVNGYVHCDPHPGNVLVKKCGKNAEIVLLDHGLYVTLSQDFRITYSKFWQSVLSADLKSIEHYGEQLGVGELFGLFACMVTARSWDSISKGIDKKSLSKDEQNEIKADASKYLPEISAVLNRVPRQMLLIFKTNDLLRGIEFSLGTQSSMKSFITMSRACVKSLYSYQRQLCSTKFCTLKNHVRENWEQLKLTLYTIYLWFLRSPVGLMLNKELSVNEGGLKL